MKALAWLEERSGIGAAWRGFADRPIPGGPGLRHAVFAVLVYLFVQEAVLGIVLATYYSPSATDAWASTAYLNDQVSMGWFIRGLHDHGASAFVIVAALHVGALAVFGGYRKPRELVWVAALAVLGLGLAMGMTGNPLPWDETGYWAIQVELGIIEQTPGGGALRRLVQGGAEAGNLTLTRLFVLHAFVLPLVIGGLLAFIARRRHATHSAGQANSAGQGSTASNEPSTGTYAPAQMFYDALAMTVCAVVLIAWTVKTHGTELFGPADPTANFQARPEWYFLFLYKLRMVFEGPMEAVATMLIPGAAAAFLVAVPALEALAGRVGRIAALVGLGTLLAGVVTLTAVAISDDKADESYQKSLDHAQKQAERARTLAKEGVVPEGGPAVFWNDPEYKIRKLFEEHCQNCHAIEGIGGGEAPDLTDYSSREWLSSLVRDATQERFFGKTKHDDMEPYPEDKLPAEQLTATVEYVVFLMGDESMKADEELAKKGAILWKDELECSNCHEVEAGKDNEGPTLFAHGTTAWVTRVIRDSSAKDLFGEEAEMPKFGTDKLSDEQVASLAAFVVAQRAKVEAAPSADPSVSK
jgi:ubiquinol-cytochrome c reductase cytochrome b subunit